MKSLLQTKEWGALRQAQGWRVHWVDEILVLEKPLPFGLSFLYSPEPDFFQIDFAKFLPKIKEIAQKSHSIFIRLDFLNKIDTIYSQKITTILQKNHFIKSFEEIQPEFRQIIDISKSEETILSKMKQKGRYNIKIAQRSQLSVIRYPLSDEKETQNGIDIFYDIFKETAKRDGFQIRPKKYFEDLLNILQPKGLAELLIARYNNIIIAAAIITFYDETASYLYGASASEHRETMAPYLLHWEAIKIAKEKNCKIYDLLAIAPFENSSQLTANSSQQKTKKPLAVSCQPLANHKYAGITRFKEQFGGQKIQTIGSWDLVLKSCWYWLFKIIEKMRRKS